VAVPTGTSTPWRELITYEAAGDLVVYLRDGSKSGSADLLAEALRADGVVRTLGRAIPIAEDATLELGFYGTNDDGDEELCTPDGMTARGEQLSDPQECVVALLDTTEV
jgi:hypothetical protein